MSPERGEDANSEGEREKREREKVREKREGEIERLWF